VIGRNGMIFRGRGTVMLDGEASEVNHFIVDELGLDQFSDEELEYWRVTLEARRDYLAEYGIPYVFTVAPRKSLIYPENLPASVQNRLRESKLEQLLNYLSVNSDILVVDLVTALRKAKQVRQGPELYFKTDGHWNAYGAYWAYYTIFEQIAALFPGKALSPLE